MPCEAAMEPGVSDRRPSPVRRLRLACRPGPVSKLHLKFPLSGLAIAIHFHRIDAADLSDIDAGELTVQQPAATGCLPRLPPALHQATVRRALVHWWFRERSAGNLDPGQLEHTCSSPMPNRR
jgi:hypothetical protein